MELLGKWWNGAWGRLSRRDVWLYRQPERWLVRAREGTGDAPFRDLGWEFDDEDEARGMVERLTGDGAEWKDMTESYLRKRGSDEGGRPGADERPPPPEQRADVR